MKKANLCTAIIAGLAADGWANIHNIVTSFFPKWVGQVLVYPYYTEPLSTESAVKVRFLEASNLTEMQARTFTLYGVVRTPPSPIVVLSESHSKWPHLLLHHGTHELHLVIGPRPEQVSPMADMVMAVPQLVTATAPDYHRRTFIITRRYEVDDVNWSMIDLTPEHIPDHVRKLTARTQRQLKPNPFASRQTARHGGYTPGASGPRRTPG